MVALLLFVIWETYVCVTIHTQQAFRQVDLGEKTGQYSIVCTNTIQMIRLRKGIFSLAHEKERAIKPNTFPFFVFFFFPFFFI